MKQNQREWFSLSNRIVFFMLLSTLSASLLGNLLAGKNTKGSGICKKL